MKKIIVTMLTLGIIFSCSKNINEEEKASSSSSSTRETYFKVCEFMNQKIKNELFLVESDRCIASMFNTDNEFVEQIKKAEKIC